MKSAMINVRRLIVRTHAEERRDTRTLDFEDVVVGADGEVMAS